MKPETVHHLIAGLASCLLVACGGAGEPREDTNIKPQGVGSAKAVMVGTAMAAAPCSDWVASQIYTQGMCTSYQNKTYEAKWWTQGNVPGAEQWGPWKLLDAPPPPPPPPPNACADWSSTLAYSQGACVGYQGKTYEAKWWTQGNVPGAEQWGPWKLMDTPPPPPPPPPPPTGGAEIGSYFAQWGVYGRGYEIADIHTTKTMVNGVATSVADQLTFINYAFGNTYAKNGGYECDMLNRAESGDGNGGDAYADYQRQPARTVNGQPVAWDAKLSGNFAQIKLLKAAHPNLKVFISLGGWSWSKNFSAAAKTAALRKQLVDSCVKLFIAGDLPVQDGRGGPGAARGVFDGIDIDWEYPGGGGLPYNSVDVVNDKHNYTLLMAEFRARLDAQGAADGRRYLLTAAIGAGSEKIAQTEPAQYSQYMDWVNLMSYDFHGGWESTTNFHAPLYRDPADPATGVLKSYNANDAVQTLVTAGMPRNKILLGLPFYGRGWNGVAAGPNGNGLYQPTGGAAPGAFEAGINDYKVLKDKAGTRGYHPITKQLYLLTPGGEWWSYDDPAVIRVKMQYVRDQGLRGAFSWELDGDASGELTSEVWRAR